MPQTKFCHDYYLILEISQKADIESIRSNYKRLARLKHPDKNLNNPNATAEFQLVCNSFVLLVSLTLIASVDPGSILDSQRPC